MLEAELEPPQKSKIESFATIVNGFEPLNVLAKLSILDFCGGSNSKSWLSLWYERPQNDPNYTFNPAHNILQIYDVLEHIFFTKSKTENDVK